MADEIWNIKEDGYLDLEVECSSITYHPNLNIVLVLSKSSEVLVIDVNSGLLLQKTVLSANNGKLQATYLAGHDKILLLDERGVGVRTDYNGVLLLDSILQTPVTKANDIIKLELLLSEVVMLHQTLESMDLQGVEHTKEVVAELANQINQAQQRNRKGIKAQKWNTVCLQLPHSFLKWVCSGVVAELKRQNRHIPALTIASAINERLNSLLPTPSDGQPVDRTLMFSEATRRQTFSKWPHMNYKWALPDQMAQAGFYHTPNSAGDDRAMCFTCIVCLVCWEPSDEPWSEHERHSPTCPFVKGEYTQNVPLSVTYATAPAFDTGYTIDILGTSSVPELIPTASSSGSITIWNCSRQLKIEATIHVIIKSDVYSDLPLKKEEAWTEQEVVEIPLSGVNIDNLVDGWNGCQEMKVGAVSVVGEGAARPVLVAGINITGNGSTVSPLVQAMNNVNLGVDITKVPESKLRNHELKLVVYDFHYYVDSENVDRDNCASKTLVSGTGTSTSRQENSDMYSDIFLSKFLCTAPSAMHDVVYHAQEIMVNDNFPGTSSSTSMNCPVPLGVAVPTAGGGSFDASMAINEGLDMTTFPSTSNGSPPLGDLEAQVSQVPVLGQYMQILVDDDHLSITGLHPTRDGKHLLVVLNNILKELGGMLLLYKVNSSGPAVTLLETPVATAKLNNNLVSLTLLPLEDTGSLGNLVAVTSDGLLVLIDISTLQVKASVSHQDGSKFVSIACCNSLERVCAASEKGSLHFFTLHDEDFGETEESLFGEHHNYCSPRGSTLKENIVLVNAPTLDLTALYELTRFENLVPCFAATVPACWTELMQAQKQRRHPQHLQHADDVHHTRSWRLENDSSSWDEHIFELTLPRSVCIGHVDLKFSLQAQCQIPPCVQFTLLKQNAAGIGKLSDNCDIDSSIDFNISPDTGPRKGATVNPVTTEQFARAHNTEILCGPIKLTSCLDLTEQSGTVTFTSPKLFKMRGRTLLVHIKALANTSSERETKLKSWPSAAFWDYNASTSNSGSSGGGSAVDRLASSVTNKKMEYNGCDWLHEISITVRKTKQTDVPNERAERCAMLESDSLVDRLLSVVTSDAAPVQQNMACDILVWLATVRLERLRPSTSQQSAFTSVVTARLNPLLHSCFVRGGRTLARKCVKLLTLCSDGLRNIQDRASATFDSAVVTALLNTLPQVPQCWSAGAMRWYFTLLSHLVSVDTLQSASTETMTMLKQVAQQLYDRQNPYHLLLQTKFNLYGTPFEAELFDQEPPVPTKLNNTVSYTAVVSEGGVWNTVGSNGTPEMTTGPEDLRDLLNLRAKINGEGRTGNSNNHLRGLTANHYMKGLLEVQPLHFICHTTSDGTKLEKIDTGGTAGPLVNYFDVPPSGTTLSPISPLTANHVANIEPNRRVDNEQERVPWQQLVMKPPQHSLVVERMHSGARRFVILDLGCPVLLTDLFVPASPELLSLSIDLWLVSEEQDAQRLVVAPDITTKTLIMNDIQPPPLVRFIKITTIGRYGMNTTKCRIPIGNFYGHLLILPGEDYAEKSNYRVNYPNPQNQIGILNALFEDIQCRYSLACSKMQELLGPLLTAETANISHMHHFMRCGSDTLKPTTSKINTVYQECITYQHQLNSVRSVMRRLGAHNDLPQTLASACSDKLRVLGQCLLDTLLHLVQDLPFNSRGTGPWDQSLCHQLFDWLCIAEDTRMQLSTCTLLVRMCGLQSWWGDFLVSTLTQLYSTRQTNVFPQDRVFLLLVFMGRKSLCGGASRTTVIDSVLKTLLQQLTPLAVTDSAPAFLRSNMDLSLIGWLLLFLSQCLDFTTSSSEDAQDKIKSDKDLPGSRWDFLQGELSMQRRMNAVGRSNPTRGYRRKLQKKLMHHKQQLEDLEVAKKAFQVSTQVSDLSQLLKKKALSALSSQAAKLSYKLETALKQQEQFLRKSVKQQASTSKTSKESDGQRGSEIGSSSSKPSRSSTTVTDNSVLFLPRGHCLPVARALVALLLHMDSTSNLDTFLLTCKVVARVGQWSRPNLVLRDVLTEQQLAHLVRLAVWDDQRCSSWARHAITCLLQDTLEGGVSYKGSSPDPNPGEEELEQETTREDESSNSRSEDTIEPVTEHEEAHSPGDTTNKTKTMSNFPLPSLLESDDSELEDLLDDILERSKSLVKKPSITRGGVPIAIVSNVSTAVDSRLEYGVDTNAEITLRRMTAHGAYNLPISIGAPISTSASQAGVNYCTPARWEDSLISPWSRQSFLELPSSTDMLSHCFNRVFMDLTSKESSSNVELVLQLWLTLNLDHWQTSGDSRSFDPGVVPSIALSPPAISALIQVLDNRVVVSVRCWCLAFQALTLLCNLPTEHSDNNLNSALQRTSKIIITDHKFPCMLLAFFSSPRIKGPAGVSVCQSLHELLVRLQIRSDAVSARSQLGAHLKLQLLQVFDLLVKPEGALALQQGPQDAQAKLVQLMMHLDFTNTDINTCVNVINSVALLVHSYMVSGESLRWQSLADCTIGKCRPASWDLLVVSVARLATHLVDIPLEAPLPYASSQTDEHKAANTRVPCVADIVLQQEQTTHWLLGALGPASSLIIDSVQEPTSVAQAVFHLLSALARKATKPKFILKPVFSYISTNDGGVTEPMLTLLLRLLDSDEALNEFVSLGALEVVSEHLVRNNHSLVNCQPSNVSAVMQHMSQAPAALLPSSKKPSDCGSGLLNFAPLGCITSSNPTAHPADVLIQSSPPHRRARNPAWSYHFYPDETWVELTITLPCAVLLREVHLQPHLTSLATCPSGVGIEISRDGRSPLVPVSLPLDCSGLTFIRLQLPKAEIVTTVLLRLYKPRDSSNIGLSQLRLLGNTTFSDSTVSNLFDEDDTSYDSSVVWVRLVYHCITVCQDTQLRATVVSAITSVTGVLQVCCGLLLTPMSSRFTPQVLFTLCTHNPDLGLQTITTLLTIGSTQFHQGGVSTAGMHSVVGLLYLLCTTKDSHSEERVKAVLSWLLVTATETTPVSAAYVQCVAAILWASPDLSHLISDQIFSVVCGWALTPGLGSGLKRAIDSVLCAMCHVRPALFPSLLQRVGALVPISDTGHAASVSDDRKDSSNEAQTDDSKKEEAERSEWYHQLVLQDLRSLSLTESQLMTVAVACQSPPAMLQLLDSGLPRLLTDAVLEFCTRKHSERRCGKQTNNQSRLTDSDKASGRNHSVSEGSRPMVQLEVVTHVLHFFAEVCSEGVMRDWLGSAKGSEFWLPLLNVLCCRPTNNTRCEMISESLSALESATVKFLSRCCWCHPNNQKLLANILCNVISQQRSNGEAGISGVTRRIVLQLLLESERVAVCVNMPNGCIQSSSTPPHPRHGVGNRSLLLYLSVHTTCGEVLHMLYNTGSSDSENKSSIGSKESLREIIWPEVSEQLFLAAGVLAKDKRTKDFKNTAVSMFKDKSFIKKPHNSSPSIIDSSRGYEALQHPEMAGMCLPSSLTLSQLLTLLSYKGVSVSSQVSLAVCPKTESEDNVEVLLSTPSFPTCLQVFTQQGGLALLAEHLPLVYPETLLYFRTSTAPQPVLLPTTDQVDADWVKVEGNDDIYEDVEENIVAPYVNNAQSGGSGMSKNCETATPSVPLHSLAAFGLFLRLPGYAEVLLKDKQKAQCLLRLVLGVSDDGDGGDIMSNPVASSLPTLPFEVLKLLLESTPLSTDDSVLLRRTTLEQGALHLLLSCLSVFTHQPAGTNSLKSVPQSRNKSDDKSHLYWAKGTGFGTGSTTQSWNVEQALSRQRSEEQHVTVLLQVLSSYINPGGVVSTDSSDEDSDPPSKPPRPQPLPTCVHDLLLESCLLPALSSYLRNDSVLDMARHIPLYCSVLRLLRALAQDRQLVSLLLPRKTRSTTQQLSVVCLLLKMKNVVDTYASRLKINKPKTPKKVGRATERNSKQYEEMLESDEGLALLIPDIQETADLVQTATDRLVYESESDSESVGAHDMELPLQQSLEQRYLEVMKPLQFDTFEMITESSDCNGIQFVESYHFESNVRASGDRSHPARVKRLAQETVTLSTSLPLSFSSSVFVRCDSDRLDIMKVLITGPAETPYANGCFELDVYFPPDYPNSPMLINLETTGHHTIRFNPNLYNDGKVCLSVLNTWHGRPEEKWNAQTSSFLQVLVSIQSLILVPEPYFNEPGYERARGTPAGNQSSREYNSNICQATVKWAMLEQLRNPSPCFKQVIQTHFWMKRDEIKRQIEAWIADMEKQSSDKRTGRTISMNTIALKRHFIQLCEELAKLNPPPGLEDIADSEEPSWQDMEKLVSQFCE